MATQKIQTHVKYAVVTALACIVVQLILITTGYGFEKWATVPIYLITLTGFILNAINFSNVNNNDVSFGDVFASGFKMAAIYTLIMLVWMFLSNALFPEIMEKSMEMARQEMTKKGMSDEQIDDAMAMTKKYKNVILISGALFGNLVLGVICSLIGAAVAKKKPQSTLQQS